MSQLRREVSSAFTRREEINKKDVEEQIALESRDSPSTVSLSASILARQNIISFAHDDPDNPRCWSNKWKAWIVFVGIATVMNSTIGSSIASGATDTISEYFDIHNQAQLVLPTSIFLVGYVLGPLVFSPLSESYGRRWVMIGTFVRYASF